jgi:hypothetical protein
MLLVRDECERALQDKQALSFTRRTVDYQPAVDILDNASVGTVQAEPDAEKRYFSLLEEMIGENPPLASLPHHPPSSPMKSVALPSKVTRVPVLYHQNRETSHWTKQRCLISSQDNSLFSPTLEKNRPSVGNDEVVACMNDVTLLMQ